MVNAPWGPDWGTCPRARNHQISAPALVVRSATARDCAARHRDLIWAAVWQLIKQVTAHGSVKLEPAPPVRRWRMESPIALFGQRHRGSMSHMTNHGSPPNKAIRTVRMAILTDQTAAWATDHRRSPPTPAQRNGITVHTPIANGVPVVNEIRCITEQCPLTFPGDVDAAGQRRRR